MTYNLVRKRGIPVLAYPTSDAASQWSCSLVVRHSEARMQATISLQSSVPVHGFDDEQAFTLVYNADNLVPGTTSLGPATIPLPQAGLKEIARQGNAQIRTLSLTLTNPCPIWCPRSSGSIAPKHGFSSRFHQLVKLARATELHILFDYNWLHQDNHAQFLRLINHPEKLTGFPVDSYANLYRQADWSVFSPVEDAVSEAPPSYTNPSNKRPRQVATSSTHGSPSPKRVLLSPALAFAPSPTEKATTASTPSPKPPSSPVAIAPDFQEAINSAVETLLPEALQTILPDMLPRLFTVPLSSPSPSPPSLYPNPNPMSSLATLISSHVAAYAEAQLRKIYAETLDHAAYLRSVADVEFQEVLDEQRLDITMVKDDGISEINRVFDYRLDEFRQSTAEIVDEVGEHAENVYADVCQRLDSLVGKESECLRRETECLRRETECLRRERACLRREIACLRREREMLEGDRNNFEERKKFKEKRNGTGRNTTGGRDRRAISLPL